MIRILLESYPVTVSDLVWELKVSNSRVMRCLKALQSRGIVELEPLPGKTFVRLMRTDFHFVGRKPTQRKRVKKKGGKGGTGDYEGIMYG